MHAFERQTDNRRPSRNGPGFSITELLVVIAILVLLAGLLVVAMGKVRESSLRTSTLSTMQNFGRACDAFQMEHGHYPGVIPEEVLAKALDDGGIQTLTSTENALLHMMGGYRVLRPAAAETKGQEYEEFQQFVDYDEELKFGDWLLRVKRDQIGQGPIINRKPYAPYYTPGPHELRTVRGQVPNDMDPDLPDLVDAWGNPILYTRRIRTSGQLVWAIDNDDYKPQFVINGWMPYLESESLGDRGLNQLEKSLLATADSAADDSNMNRYSVAAQIIRHPSFGTWNVSPLHEDNRGRVTPRGEYVLISAGPDGIYFDFQDGPGFETPGDADIVTGEFANPKVIESYDDIVIFGGG